MANPKQPPTDRVPEQWDDESAARDAIEATEPQKLEQPPQYPHERPHFLDDPEDEPDTDVELPSEDAPPSNEV